jgi:hypothetical protein
MANVWRSLFSRKPEPEERFSMDDWAKSFNYNGNEYPLAYSSITPYSKKEEPDGGFQGMVQGAYKRNGVVFACCLTRMLLFSEARFQFQGLKNGRPGDLFGTTELEILETPWPNATTGELLSRAIQDVDLAGNFFCVREGNRLRRLQPDWVDIVLTLPPAHSVRSDIAGYVYKPGGTEDSDNWELYPIDGSNGRVAHWAPIPDPEAQYRGMTWMSTVLDEVQGDQAALDHKNAFYRNAATPNIAVSFKETVTNEQFKEFMKAVDREHTGPSNAYKTLYLGGGADVKPLTVDFQALDFKNISGAGETRIAAAARVHPVVVGLSEGLGGSSLNSGNFRSARDAFSDGTMRPMWRTFCAAMESVVKVPSNSRLWYDVRDIAYLREDVKDMAEIQTLEATTITKLIQDGYTPESIVLAVSKQDWTLLKHTGLYSVQLQPPMPDGPPQPDGSLVKPPNSRPGRPSKEALGKAQAGAATPSGKTDSATPKAAPKTTPPATKKQG